VSDPVGAIVLGAHPGNVDTVLVAGNLLKRQGKLIGIDWAALLESARESNARLTQDVS
jgi:5-methylthioadenosine/S-adenosylhomocysteine deaminase